MSFDYSISRNPATRNSADYSLGSTILFAVVSVIGIAIAITKQSIKSVKLFHFARAINSKISKISCEKDKCTDDDDELYLNMCHDIRLSIINKPKQSNFRVVCILIVVDNDQNFITMIVGTNDEPSSFIGSSICAERSALLQYRLFQIERQDTIQSSFLNSFYIKSIYIASDCIENAISPGMLCREYMFGYYNSISITATRIVLQAAYEPPNIVHTNFFTMLFRKLSTILVNDKINHDTVTNKQSVSSRPTPWITTLGKLYPYPSIYMKLNVDEQIELGTLLESCHYEMIQDKIQSIQITHSPHFLSKFSDPNECTLLDLLKVAQQNAKIGDNRTNVHPICYGSAAYIEVSLTTHNTRDCNKELIVGQSIINQTSSTTKSNHIVSSSQQKALEYGSTQDSICQLISASIQQCKVLQNQEQKMLQLNNSGKKDDVIVSYSFQLLTLVQTDQFSIIHSPFASARSLLVENEYGINCNVLVMSERKNDTEHCKLPEVPTESKPLLDMIAKNEMTTSLTKLLKTVAFDNIFEIKLVTAEELAPFIPKFR